MKRTKIKFIEVASPYYLPLFNSYIPNNSLPIFVEWINKTRSFRIIKL